MKKSLIIITSFFMIAWGMVFVGCTDEQEQTVDYIYEYTPEELNKIQQLIENYGVEDFILSLTKSNTPLPTLSEVEILMKMIAVFQSTEDSVKNKKLSITRNGNGLVAGTGDYWKTGSNEFAYYEVYITWRNFSYHGRDAEFTINSEVGPKEDGLGGRWNLVCNFKQIHWHSDTTVSYHIQYGIFTSTGESFGSFALADGINLLEHTYIPTPGESYP